MHPKRTESLSRKLANLLRHNHDRAYSDLGMDKEGFVEMHTIVQKLWADPNDLLEVVKTSRRTNGEKRYQTATDPDSDRLYVRAMHKHSVPIGQ